MIGWICRKEPLFLTSRYLYNLFSKTTCLISSTNASIGTFIGPDVILLFVNKSQFLYFESMNRHMTSRKCQKLPFLAIYLNVKADFFPKLSNLLHSSRWYIGQFLCKKFIDKNTSICSVVCEPCLAKNTEKRKIYSSFTVCKHNFVQRHSQNCLHRSQNHYFLEFFWRKQYVPCFLKLKSFLPKKPESNKCWFSLIFSPTRRWASFVTVSIYRVLKVQITWTLKI